MFHSADDTGDVYAEPSSTGVEETRDLVISARAGDEAAWRRLHVKFESLLRSVTAHYRLSGDDAADVIQNTWAKCFENLGTLREPAALAGWLAAICRHEAVRALRFQARCSPVDFSEDSHVLAGSIPTDPTAAEALETLVRRKQDETFDAMLEELCERDRNLVRALTTEGTNYQDIASTLNMPIGSIGPTRRRIITKLRRKARALDLAA